MTKASRATERAGDVQFFEAAADLREWLAANHETATELWLGL